MDGIERFLQAYDDAFQYFVVFLNAKLSYNMIQTEWI